VGRFRLDEWKRSWWILLTLVPYGWLAWAAFGWAAYRAREWRWTPLAVIFLAVIPLEFAFQGRPAGIMVVVSWPAAVIAALAIRRRYLARTAAIDHVDRVKWARRGGRPSVFLRNPVLRRVVMPLFTLGVFGYGCYRLYLAATVDDERLFELVVGASLCAAGGMASLGVAIGEERFGSGRMVLPRALLPQLRYTVHEASADGSRLYELRPSPVLRLLIPAMFVGLFAGLPSLIAGPLPPWLTLTLVAAGLAAALPQIVGPKASFRFGDGSMLYRGQGLRLRAQEWYFAQIPFYGAPAGYLLIEDAQVDVPPWTQPYRYVNGFFDEDPTEILNVQMLLDAARRAGPDVLAALTEDLQSGVPPDDVLLDRSEERLTRA
jgi:hypothetical protein